MDVGIRARATGGHFWLGLASYLDWGKLHVLTPRGELQVGRRAEHTGLVLQTPISIFQRIQKDGASALKEILPKTKLWIPGNGGLQAYKQAGTCVSACQTSLFLCPASCAGLHDCCVSLLPIPPHALPQRGSAVPLSAAVMAYKASKPSAAAQGCRGTQIGCC